MYDRLIRLIGEHNLEKLKNTKVLLVGIGGVGSFALECLARSGIGYITIVDGDIYQLSNLNRQIGSKIGNIGKSKIDETIKRIKNINNDINIIGYNEHIDNSTIYKYVDFDYIIDACDDIEAKILLIKHANNNNIKIVCSCGTGKRIDPSKIKTTTLNKTYNDPLAKLLRNKLNKENIKLNIPVVFSDELPVNNDKTISSIITVTATAGIYLASWVIDDIIKNK